MRGMGSSLRYSFRAPVMAWTSSIEVRSEHMSAEKRGRSQAGGGGVKQEGEGSSGRGGVKQEGEGSSRRGRSQTGGGGVKQEGEGSSRRGRGQAGGGGSSRRGRGQAGVKWEGEDQAGGEGEPISIGDSTDNGRRTVLRASHYFQRNYTN